MLTLTAVLRQRVQHQPQQVGWRFLIDGETQVETLTYAELDQRARTIANRLQSENLAGERALLLYPSGLDYIAAFFGCLYAGVVAVPAYPPRPHQRLDRVAAIAQNARSCVILTTRSLQQQIQPALVESLGFANTTWIRTDELTGDFEEWSEPAIAPDHLAFLQYTSGSTGTPKGVMVSHANLMHNLAQIYQAFRHSPQSAGVIWLPPYHDMGLIGGILQPLYGGFPVTLMSPVIFLQKPIRWLQAISHDRATTSGAPNFAYKLCLEKTTLEQRSTLDLSSWDLAFTGAEPIQKETLERFATAFKPYGFRSTAFYSCYGLAEATLLVAGGSKGITPKSCEICADALTQNRVEIATGVQPARSLVSCGTAAEQTLAIVHPKTLQPCANDEIGEIWVTGESVAQGYWQEPEATAQTFQAQLVGRSDRWLRTGDLGFLQAGELYITGRIKDVLIIRGRNYYPQDIEHTVAASHPSLNPLAGAAFSVDIGGTEQLAVVQEVHRSQWRSLDTESIIAAIRHTISQEYGLQVYAIQLLKPGSIPKTSSGKIQRYRCQQKFQENSLNTLYQWSILQNDFLSPRTLTYSVSSLPKESSFNQFKSMSDSVQNQVKLNQDYPPSPLPQEEPSPETSFSFRDCRNEASENFIGKSVNQADAMIDWLRDYANHHLNSRLMDERRCILPHVVLDFGNRGLLGMQVSQAYGGLALSYADTMRILQQLGAIDPTLALFVGLNNVLGIRPILQYGQPSLKEELLPLLATGRELAAFALTEAEAGSNPQAIATLAIPGAAGSWHLNGTKIWSGSAAWAGVINVFAQQVDAQGRSLGMGAFAVRRGSAGLRQGSEALTMGMRGMVQNTVHLDQVPVPTSHQLGATGAGMMVAQDAMMLGRLAIAAASVGGMKRCVQLIQRYSSRRSIATGKLLEHPVLLTRLNGILCAISAVEALVNHLTTRLDHNQSIPVEAYAACKISAPEFYWQAADLLVQTLGGRGYIETNLAPQILRDARVLRIFEGPTETLCGFLGARVLHQPTELDHWLRQDLAAPEIADRLHQAVQQIQAVPHPFSDTVTAHRWTAHVIGELATIASLWAALGSSPNPQAMALRWIQQHFEQTLATALLSPAVYATATPTTQQIANYATDIGEIEQTWAAMDAPLDEWLQRDPPLRYQRSSAPYSAFPHPPTPSPKIGEGEFLNLFPSPMLGEGITRGEGDLATGDLGGSVRREIQTWMMEWLSHTLKISIADINPDRAFADYGIDSIMAVELAQALQDTWNIQQDLDATIAWNFPTIAALASHLATLIEPAIAATKVQTTDRSFISPDPTTASGDLLDQLSTQDMAALLAQEIANSRQRIQQ